MVDGELVGGAGDVRGAETQFEAGFVGFDHVELPCLAVAADLGQHLDAAHLVDVGGVGVGGVGDAVLRQVADAGVGCRQGGGGVGRQGGSCGRVVEAAGLLGLAEADVFLVVVVGFGHWCSFS